MYTIGLQYNYTNVGGSFEEKLQSLIYTRIQIIESERSSRKQRGKFAFRFWTAMRCSCLIRKIIPEHCTIIKTTFEEISFWLWKW